MPVRFTLNGVAVTADVADPHTTLLAFLRERGFVGQKEGCAEGECGACAVVIVRPGAAGGAAYQTINSCLFLLASADGAQLLSVEGVAQDETLHPVQRALVREGGSQCGYCTPGFVMSMFTEYYRPDRDDGFDAEAIAGNLCRCTGYRPICDALKTIGPAAADDFSARLRAPAPAIPACDLRSADGNFFRPTDLDELLAFINANPDAKIISGGTDLVVAMNLQRQRWSTLVSIEAVDELRAVSWQDDHITIGAAATLTDIERALNGRVPLFHDLFPLFSSRLIRNRATLGGNVANASPIGDASPVLLALDATLVLQKHGGSRSLPLADFFVDYRKTALAPGEIVHSIRVPLPLAKLSRFYKVSKRKFDDIAIVAAAFAIDVDAQGRITAARLAFGGVAATPKRALAAERALLGEPFGPSAATKIHSVLDSEFSPLDDHRASARYRRHLVASLFAKFATEMAVSE